MELLLASLFGILFGFVLQRVGAADPDKIMNMLRLRDLELMKTILFAIGLSSVLLFAGIAMNLIPADHLSIKPMYAGVTIGGMILGLGWALSGFCPGTGVAALGTGRKDAAFFFLGGLVGAALYMVMYASLKDSAMMQPLFGGAVTLAANEKSASLFSEYSGFLIAGIVGVSLMAIAAVLPNSLRK